ncbi:TlpA disulfide reductase family protein [Geothrix sp. PMB-07]|uniref:TlpA family protein disulfide reductase n=1 Tax=Geothrix sp. PMB-07 TaxID=3068640 RepID=UPI002740EB2B|nr:TlpA disulfide reductase family protein [Geothrix sp. PMB-07]WLT30854.1 TlpA disulfide reductase family protein [Geothrix sp. PMB-07]
MTRRLPAALALLAAPVVMAAPQAPAPSPLPGKLTVGDPAPALKASRWVKGTPVAGFEKGRIYVVEFWATWCGPCRQSIPHLTEMAKQFEGKATFIGMSVWERGEAPEKVEANVDAFVKEMGDKMAYHVARDTGDAFMAQAWMQAASQKGIPAAFIVNGDGQIAWIGHPMDGLDKVLANVVAEKHDLAAAKADAEKAAAAEARRSQAIAEFGKPLQAAQVAKDYPKLLSLAKEAAAKYPDQAELFDRPRFTASLHVDEAQAAAMIEAEKAKAEPDMGIFGYLIASEPGLSKDWYAKAVTILEATLKEPEASPALRPYLAKALHLAGRSKEAAAIQEAFVSEARGKAPEARLKQFEADLKTYQDAAKAEAETAPAAKKPVKKKPATKG